MRIGLTGGIACGKSSVCERFAAHGIDIIDADRIAREVVAPGMPALDEIAAQFGSGILNDDGTLNRKALKARIFQSPEEKAWLEACLHPKIRARMAEEATKAKSPYVILDIPLLLESNHDYQINRLLVIDCEPETQIRRAMQRDNCPRETVEAIMANQVPRETRLIKADDVIHNDGDLAALTEQVDALHQHYLKLSAD